MIEAECAFDDLHYGEDGNHDEYADDSPEHVALAFLTLLRFVGVREEHDNSVEEVDEGACKCGDDERIEDDNADPADEMLCGRGISESRRHATEQIVKERELHDYKIGSACEDPPL